MSQKAYSDLVEGTYVEPGHDVAAAAIKALYDVDTRPGPNAGRSIKGRETDAQLMHAVAWLASPEAGLGLPPDYLDPVACAVRLVRKQAAEIEELKMELKRIKGS